MTFLRSNLIRQKSGFYTNGMVTPCPLATIQPLMLIPSRHFCIEFTQFITGRNEVVAKVIFLHLSVIHSVHGGGDLPQCMLGYHPPRPGRPPPDQADTPSGTRQAPWDQADPPRTRQTPPPGPGRPPRTRQTPHPDQADTPPGSRLQHTVYERPVRILLECILVLI